MRHDTILYAKQSNTDDIDGGVADGGPLPEYQFDYVEPQLNAYSRLAAAARRLGTLAGEEDLFQGQAALLAGELQNLTEMLDRAGELSITELEGRELDTSEIDWIRSAGSRIEEVENNLLNLLGLFDEKEEADPDRLKTTIIADVHTFKTKARVLDVASGYLENTAILHQLPSGEWGVAVGPAFSYHEFEQVLEDRLTDEALCITFYFVMLKLLN